MSVIIETFIQCDSCGSNFGVDDRYRTAKQHRENAKKEGWKHVKGKDFCTYCLTIAPKTSAIGSRIASRV